MSDRERIKVCLQTITDYKPKKQKEVIKPKKGMTPSAILNQMEKFPQLVNNPLFEEEIKNAQSFQIWFEYAIFRLGKRWGHLEEKLLKEFNIFLNEEETDLEMIGDYWFRLYINRIVFEEKEPWKEFEDVIDKLADKEVLYWQNKQQKIEDVQNVLHFVGLAQNYCDKFESKKPKLVKITENIVNNSFDFNQENAIPTKLNLFIGACRILMAVYDDSNNGRLFDKIGNKLLQLMDLEIKYELDKRAERLGQYGSLYANFLARHDVSTLDLIFDYFEKYENDKENYHKFLNKLESKCNDIWYCVFERCSDTGIIIPEQLLEKIVNKLYNYITEVRKGDSSYSRYRSTSIINSGVSYFSKVLKKRNALFENALINSEELGYAKDYAKEMKRLIDQGVNVE